MEAMEAAAISHSLVAGKEMRRESDKIRGGGKRKGGTLIRGLGNHSVPSRKTQLVIPTPINFCPPFLPLSF